MIVYHIERPIYFKIGNSFWELYTSKFYSLISLLASIAVNFLMSSFCFLIISKRSSIDWCKSALIASTMSISGNFFITNNPNFC